MKELFIVFLVLILMVGCGNGNFEKLDVTMSERDALSVIEKNGDEAWDYVYIGDSFLMDLGPAIGETLEKDLGVDIEVHNWYIPGDHSTRLLQRITSVEEFRQDIIDAEIIVLEVPWHVFKRPYENLIGLDEYGCNGLSPKACIEEASRVYQSDTTAIFNELVKLTDSSKTIIRVMDVNLFYVNESKESGIFSLVNDLWRECNGHVIEEAAKYNIPTIRVYDAFMGESGEEDPMDNGLVTDSIHASEEGIELVIELFRDAGYNYAP